MYKLSYKSCKGIGTTDPVGWVPEQKELSNIEDEEDVLPRPYEQDDDQDSCCDEEEDEQQEEDMDTDIDTCSEISETPSLTNMKIKSGKKNTVKAQYNTILQEEYDFLPE
jgi:hypothetical protein